MQHDGRDRNDCRYGRTRDLHNGDHHHRNNDEHHDCHDNEHVADGDLGGWARPDRRGAARDLVAAG
jgi:hypothetical protein